MAELHEWRTQADQNNQAPPDGAPEGMARGAVNNTMREMMAVIRRWLQGVSGELAAASADGLTYTLMPAATYTSLTAGMQFTFRAPIACMANPVLAIGALSANIKKVVDAGAVNLNAGDIKAAGVYQVVYVVGTGWVMVGGTGGGSAVLTADDIPNLNASKITAGTFALARIPNLDAGKITSGIFNVLRIPNLNANKIVSGIFALARIPVLDNTKLPDTVTKKVQPGGSGFEVTKITVADAMPALNNLQDGEVYFEY